MWLGSVEQAKCLCFQLNDAKAQIVMLTEQNTKLTRRLVKLKKKGTA